jgi:hypothetical protein
LGLGSRHVKAERVGLEVSDGPAARFVPLRMTTIVVLTVALTAFVASKSVSARLLAVAPEYASIVHRLPGYSGDGPDPIYYHAGDVAPAAIDTDSVRRAARLLPNDATYLLEVPRSAPNAEDLSLSANLFFQPALRARRASGAEWLVSYGSSLPEPRVNAMATYRISRLLVLVKLRRR